MPYWHPTQCTLQLDFTHDIAAGDAVLSAGAAYIGTAVILYTCRAGPAPVPHSESGLHFHAATAAVRQFAKAQPLVIQSVRVQQQGAGMMKVLRVVDEDAVCSAIAAKPINQKPVRRGKAKEQNPILDNKSNTSHKDTFSDDIPGSKCVIFDGSNAMPLGSVVALSIGFTGRVQRADLGGIYASDAGVLLTHFEVSFARLAFPCPDDPRYRLRWHLQSVRLPPSYCDVFSSAAMVSSRPAGGKGIVYVFAVTSPLPVYVMAFAAFSSLLDAVEETIVLRNDEGTVPLRVAAAVGSGVTHETLTKMARVTKEAIGLLEDFFDAPLPLSLPFAPLGDPTPPQLTLLVAPTMPFISGMEHHGCIFLNEDVYRSTRSTGSSSKANEETTRVELIVHELAHHWIGNALGMPFVLKEGVCQVLEQCLGDVIMGKPMRKFKPSDKAAGNDVVDTEKGNEFTGHSYQNALSTLRQVVSHVGFADFRDRMRRMYASEVLSLSTAMVFEDFLPPYISAEDFMAYMEA